LIGKTSKLPLVIEKQKAYGPKFREG